MGYPRNTDWPDLDQMPAKDKFRKDIKEIKYDKKGNFFTPKWTILAIPEPISKNTWKSSISNMIPKISSSSKNFLPWIRRKG